METHKGCTYWYEVIMYVDKNGSGVHNPARVRIPVVCISSNTDESIVRFLNPASAEFEARALKNSDLFDTPYPATNCK